jgi:hypothetical protein
MLTAALALAAKHSLNVSLQYTNAMAYMFLLEIQILVYCSLLH